MKTLIYITNLIVLVYVACVSVFIWFTESGSISSLGFVTLINTGWVMQLVADRMFEDME